MPNRSGERFVVTRPRGGDRLAPLHPLRTEVRRYNGNSNCDGNDNTEGAEESGGHAEAD